MRAGGFVLSLLATPGIVPVMRALEAEPLPLAELRRALGSPPQTTLREQLRELTDLGVLERHRESDFPRSVDYGLGQNGRDLLRVAGILERWLAGSSRPAVPLGEITAKRTVKALVDGWNSGIIAAVVAQPLSLTQLSQEVSDLTYPSVERRVIAMRAAGLMESGDSNGHGTPCLPTSWLREAAAPLAAAARLERGILGTDDALVDIQTLLMLAVPMTQPPRSASGSALLVTREGHGQGAKNGVVPDGVTVELQDGILQSCTTGLRKGTPTWALGAPDGWLEAAVDGTLSRLRFGGAEPKLATALVLAIHKALRLGEPSLEPDRDPVYNG